MGIVQRIVTWTRGHTLVGDTLLAVPFLLVIPLLIGNTPGLLVQNTTTTVTLWSCALTLPLVMRRRHPEAAALAFVAVVALQLVVGPYFLIHDGLALIMLYSVIVYGNPRHSRLFIALAALMALDAGAVSSWVLEMGTVFRGNPQDSSALSNMCRAEGPGGQCMQELVAVGITLTVGIIILLTLTCFTAYWQRARMRTAQMLRERNASIAARQQEEHHIARMAERARIARDMHDVVAHTLSIIIVQADGGRYAGANNPPLARTTMETIRHEATHALGGMTQLLGKPDHNRKADYEHITQLVDQARSAATDETIEHTVTGIPAPEGLTAETSEAIYRTVQESLTNIRKYAGRDVHVTIEERWNDGVLHLSVRDDGLGATALADGHRPGYGLRGMKERIAAAGGQAHAHPGDEGGFTVDVSVPYAAPDATSAMPAGGSETAGNTATGAPIRSFRRGLHPLRPSAPFNRHDTPSGTNHVERLSHWAQRHYLLMDALLSVILTLAFTLRPYLGLSVSTNDGRWIFRSSPIWWHNLISTLLITIPLIFRRRFPEWSGAAVATIVTAEILMSPVIPATEILTLISLSSACLYGRPRSPRVAIAVCAMQCILLSVKVMTLTQGYDTPLLWFTHHPTQPSEPTHDIQLAGIRTFAISATICASIVLVALWVRLSGTDALVLQSRYEALAAQQDRQKVAEANRERSRIGSEMQHDISSTLNQVIASANAGMKLLDAPGEHDIGPDEIAEAFEAIGDQGRTALAHMRQLLQVLRQTEESPEGARREPARLHPLAAGPHDAEHSAGTESDGQGDDTVAA